MELPEEAIHGLGLIKDTSKFSQAAFKSLVTAVFDELLGRPATNDSKDNLSVTFKHAFASLTCLVLECAKLNTDPLEMAAYLGQIQLPVDRIELLSAEYSSNRQIIRSSLGLCGFSSRHIVDVQWRLDFHVKSDSVEKLNQPTFFVRLVTKGDNGEDGNVEFTCAVEQLQDLVAKLQDATHSLNRLDLS